MTKTTRSAIIRRAKEIIKKDTYFGGICNLLYEATLDISKGPNRFMYNDLVEIFPLLTKQVAKEFCGYALQAVYWWRRFDWAGDRMKFFNYLYEQYKDDETEVEL